MDYSLLAIAVVIAVAVVVIIYFASSPSDNAKLAGATNVPTTTPGSPGNNVGSLVPWTGVGAGPPTVGGFATLLPTFVGIRPPSTNINVGATVPYYDLRTAYPGIITQAMNQQQCEACWSFATATCMSDAIRIKFQAEGSTTAAPKSQYLYQTITDPQTGASTLDVVSPYYLDSCATGMTGDSACSTPFYIDKAMQSITVTDPTGTQPMVSLLCREKQELPGNNNAGTFGCETVAQSPGCHHYSLATSRSCNTDANGNQLALVEVVNNIQNSILAGIPVVTGIQVYPSFQTFWTNGAQGIYQPQQGETALGGHALSIMGWGPVPADPAGTAPYWIIRNSWGRDAGDAGFIKFPLGVDSCGVESGSYTYTVNRPAAPSQPNANTTPTLQPNAPATPTNNQPNPTPQPQPQPTPTPPQPQPQPTPAPPTPTPPQPTPATPTTIPAPTPLPLASRIRGEWLN